MARLHLDDYPEDDPFAPILTDDPEEELAPVAGLLRLLDVPLEDDEALFVGGDWAA